MDIDGNWLLCPVVWRQISAHQHQGALLHLLKLVPQILIKKLFWFLFCQDIHQQWYLDVWHNGQIGAVDYQELFQFGECLVVDRGHIEQVRYIPAVSPNLWLSFQISSSSPVTLFVHLPRCKSFNELGVCSHHISHVNKTVGIRHWNVSRLGLKIASVFNLNLWNRENLKCKWGRAFSRHQRLDLGWITFGQIWIWYILPRKKCFENIVW